MTSKSARAETKISSICSKAGCSPAGIVWLKNAIDPFPDQKRDIVGYPDTLRSPSVCQYFKEQLAVSRPVAVVGNWDANIFHPGFFSAGKWCLTNNNDQVEFIQGTQGAPFATGVVEVRAGATGAALDVANIVSRIAPQASEDFPYRVVALGMEIYNTTAEIEIQGTLTTWRQRSIVDKKVSNLVRSIPTRTTAVDTIEYTDAPKTISQALLLEGSLEWKAKDGSYSVGIMSDPILECKSDDFIKGSVVQSTAGYYFEQLVANASGTTTPEKNKQASGFDQFGSYFTGLSSGTTLNVVLHYILERFPTSANVDLITLSKPSIPYDSKALEIYAELARSLPTGVEVKENALGDFVSAVATLVRTVAPPLIAGLNEIVNGSVKTQRDVDRIVDRSTIKLDGVPYVPIDFWETQARFNRQQHPKQASKIRNFEQVAGSNAPQARPKPISELTDNQKNQLIQKLLREASKPRPPVKLQARNVKSAYQVLGPNGTMIPVAPQQKIGPQVTIGTAPKKWQYNK